MELNGNFISTEQVIRNILIEELALPKSDIWVQSQNVVIPPDSDKLFVIIGLTDARVIGNNSYATPTETGMKQTQECIQRENIQIDLLSRDTKALNRRQEAQMAMASIFSKQTQEKYNFKIFKIPTSFVNSSEAEGTSQISRFSIVIPCHVWYRKEKEISSTDYYDDFSTRVDDESTTGQPNGLIEFNIKDE